MADFTSHILASETVLQEGNFRQSLKSILDDDRTAYYLGSQGPDILFYHKAVKDKDLSQIGSALHKKGANSQIKILLECSKNLKNQKQQNTVLAYVCGYISHYNLDKHIHPLIGYLVDTSKLSAKKDSTYYHTYFESQIDTVVYQYYHKQNIKKFRMYDYIDIANTEWHTIADAFACMLQQILNFECSRQDILDCINRMVKLNKLFYTRWGGWIAKLLCTPPAQTMHFKQKSKMSATQKMTYIDKSSGIVHDHSLLDIFKMSIADTSQDFANLSKFVAKDTDSFAIDDTLSFENGL